MQPRTTLNVHVPPWLKTSRRNRQQVSSLQSLRAPGGILLPSATMLSLNWIEPYLRRYDLSKTDMKATFQLKYRPLQRNGISLSSQKSEIRELSSFAASRPLGASPQKNVNLRSATGKTDGCPARAPTSSRLAAKKVQDTFPHEDSINRTSEGNTHLYPCHLVHEKLFDFKQICISRLHFAFTALTSQFQS